MRDTQHWVAASMFGLGLALAAVAAVDWVGYILFATSYGAP